MEKMKSNENVQHRMNWECINDLETPLFSIIKVIDTKNKYI